MNEYGWALMGNLRPVFAGAAIVLLVLLVAGGVICGAIYDTASNGEEKKRAGKRLRLGLRLVPLMFVFAAISCLPDADDLWRTRIALLKFTLASPENVTQGAEAISRIARKLECKYLAGKDCASVNP